MTTPANPPAANDAPADGGAPLHFPVVGIGASAGGLPALTALLQRMPADSGMAFVVLVHMPAKHAANLPALLPATTGMPVVTVQEQVALQPDHVYVVPPGKLLAMNEGMLSAVEVDHPRGRHATLDLFFRTLAVVHRERAFAVVLSGSGADGAVGLTRIKEEAGLTIVQDPNEAEFDAMPRAAIATGTVDWVLPVAEIPAKLVALWTNVQAIRLPHPEEAELRIQPVQPEALADAENALREVLAVVRARTGHDFRNYKRATVLRRLERRLQVLGIADLPAYRAHLVSHGEEAQALLKDLLIGVTNFFRDAEAFDLLRAEIVPELFEHAGQAPSATLRVWVPGCSTGEEAYSVAMLLCEYAETLAHPPKIQVFATDIDERAIAVARMGSYPAAIETDVTPTRLRRFFDKDGHQYRIRKEVREKVMFAVHNILHDPPFSKLDLISCRNLLIYLERQVHGQILEMFHFALRPGGMLMLGSSESADTAAEYFAVVDKKQRIFVSKSVPRSARITPALQHTMQEPLPSRVPHPLASKPTELSYAEMHRRLVEQYAPPSLLIEADGAVVHLSAHAGRFLRYPGGAPTHNVFNLVQGELRRELRSAIYQAAQSGKSVEARRVRVSDEAGASYVTMLVRPVSEPDMPRSLFLVLFNEVDNAASDAPAAAGERDPALLHLEEELRRTKEQLQSTIEHSETSNEELKASNEELQAINEELRSTTEELETSKEELQSINEELITVNHELKTKVEETAKINDDLQNLIASTDIATVFVDRGMSIKRYTPPATRLFNLIPTDVGRSLLDITHRLDYERLADDAAEAFQQLRVIEREVASHDGRWYLARVLPYRTTEDRIDGAVLTFVDVTTRRQAEETMRLLAESTRDHAIFTFDLHGRIRTWNRGAENVFGWTEAEAVGQPTSILFTPEDQQAGVPEDEMQRALDDGRAEDERWHIRKDGSRFWCSGMTTPLLDEGRLRGYGKIARDLTGSKRLEQERGVQLERESARRAEAQAAAELKDEFLALMSHELKNPLNLIQLNVELLSRAPEVRGLAPVTRASEMIRRAVSTQAQIIDDLMDLSRITTGKLSLQPQAVDLAEALRPIAELASAEAAAKALHFELQLPEQPLQVQADPVRLQQIVWNLLNNAVKFTSAGGRVALQLRSDEGSARIDVVDSGEGIAAEDLPKVFDLFSQAERGRPRVHAGMGIGLALVRDLVRAHQGRVEAHSGGLGQGSRFSVWLPLALDGTAAVPAGAKPGDALHGLRALVIDRDAMAAEVMQQLLALEGAAVVSVPGIEALGPLAGQAPFDLVLCDLGAPGADLVPLQRRLRDCEPLAGATLLAVSATSRAADARRALDAGFVAVLKKPITLEALLRAIASAA